MWPHHVTTTAQDGRVLRSFTLQEVLLAFWSSLPLFGWRLKLCVYISSGYAPFKIQQQQKEHNGRFKMKLCKFPQNWWTPSWTKMCPNHRKIILKLFYTFSFFEMNAKQHFLASPSLHSNVWISLQKKTGNKTKPFSVVPAHFLMLVIIIIHFTG